MIGTNPRILELRRFLSLVAPKRMPVLITGETGTGKEMVINALHDESGRKGPLKAINCGAIPYELSAALLFGHEKGAFTGADRRARGLFEEAHEGTLFLDEIGELSLSTQAVLLRVLQHKRFARLGSAVEMAVDVRIAAATHHDLEQRVRERSFRQDLLYRLNAVTLHVPSLRDRLDDVEPLVLHFLAQIAIEENVLVPTIGGAAIARLREHHWPGNVRELRNVIERAVAFCEAAAIDRDDIDRVLAGRASQPIAPGATDGMSTQPPSWGPSAVPPAVDESDVSSFRERVRSYEIQLINQGLQRASGKVTLAAELLRMPVRTLTHKMLAYGLRRSTA